MPVYQFLLNLSDTHGGGWTEQFFQTWPDPQTARGWMNVYIGARVMLLAKGYAIQQGRISDVTVFRDSLIQNTFFGPVLNGALGADAVSAERVFERLLVRMEAGSARRRSFELGGIPGSVIDQNGQYTAPFPFAGLLQQWMNYFLGTGIYSNPCLIHIRSAKPGIAPQQILTFSQSPAGSDQRTLFVTTNGDTTASFPVGSVVRISKTKNGTNINGNWSVASAQAVVGPPVTTLLRLSSRRYIPVFTNNTLPGVIVPISGQAVGDYATITGVIPQRGVRRKTGRPFGEPRGRSSRQV